MHPLVALRVTLGNLRGGGAARPSGRSSMGRFLSESTLPPRWRSTCLLASGFQQAELGGQTAPCAPVLSPEKMGLFAGNARLQSRWQRRMVRHSRATPPPSFLHNLLPEFLHLKGVRDGGQDVWWKWLAFRNRADAGCRPDPRRGRNRVCGLQCRRGAGRGRGGRCPGRRAGRGPGLCTVRPDDVRLRIPALRFRIPRVPDPTVLPLHRLWAVPLRGPRRDVGTPPWGLGAARLHARGHALSVDGASRGVAPQAAWRGRRGEGGAFPSCSLLFLPPSSPPPKGGGRGGGGGSPPPPPQ